MPKLGMETIRRRQVIDAVLRILGEHGWRDLTIREVADVAGVSSGIIAHYFGKKREMTIDAIAEAHRRYEQQLSEAHQSYAHPLERLVAFIDVLAGSGGREQPGWAFWLAIWGRVPFDRVLQAEAAALQRAFRQLLSNAVAQGVDLKLFRPQSSPADIADSLIALGQGLGLQHVLDGRAMPPKRLKELLLHALGRDLGVDFGTRPLPAADSPRDHAAGA
jgi:TetR/AcrR family transcriptional regulator, transcriptional repressor of bet genes